ncbi:hypothetical protein SEEM5278_00115 [Salmonella enterica subsp. enterica serovar Montevideo str. CT_02035278]|nr:hypothetical protein AW67_31290 [Salmonella enterica subsp. enterica serovar Montevideo str. USDA-ARS-USMARC-1903]EFY10682.1 hypothetical protein SEEM315_21698 [Salmonella enterica subsp. enterica serovar Montevideo str. 315996572]EFY16390.1 hypothetical protein SEEM971_02815 [Salmonella enterica subsp. enterica serovar Montevideo str. 495297-1]EFY21848.1 hypothetical protein SEEM973_02567 [Salmonella enterica subsp. enterica serovar Montevideo str. 495297-3]EFY26314.1 hypothetical protein S
MIITPFSPRIYLSQYMKPLNIIHSMNIYKMVGYIYINYKLIKG